MIQATDIDSARFTPTKWREGYDQDQVDEFLDRVKSALADWEAHRTAPMLTSHDVVTKRFQSTKFRGGYDQDDVDGFLDRAVTTLRQYESAESRLI
jgi:DivIVA domain-containing protein